ncbi:hypothetical protein CDAR_96111 [Caerostris darwini]|uniref:Uncharacterized protein n=1 Tax=Caerostris darwini TaxID=1538125 RepID=A0AAV4PUU7_9ARAC|nr:hypothetical protein CDAR_96111 [Caerostris darwini]
MDATIGGCHNSMDVTSGKIPLVQWMPQHKCHQLKDATSAMVDTRGRMPQYKIPPVGGCHQAYINTNRTCFHLMKTLYSKKLIAWNMFINV